MPKKIVLVGLLLILVLGAAYANLGEIFVDTNGVALIHNGLTGNSDANGGGDLLDTSSYVTSWAAGGLSEKITLQGRIKQADNDYIIPVGVSHYRYHVVLEGEGTDVWINDAKGTVWMSEVKTFEGAGLVTGWVTAPAVTIQIKNPFFGVLHAFFHVYHSWDLVNTAWDTFAIDKAYLRSGVGSVTAPDDAVEEGTDVVLKVVTGYSTSELTTEGGWTLEIYNPDGVSVFKTSVPDNWRGDIKWTVPPGTYTTSWDNIFDVVLRNELIDQEDDHFFTIGAGMIDDIPSKPTYEVIAGDAPFEPGESITLRLSAKENTYTIKGFHVWVSYSTSAGTTTFYIYKEKYLPATHIGDGIYTAEISFTFPDAGRVVVEASAVDVMELNSGISEYWLTVYSDTGAEPVFADGLDIAMIVAILVFAVCLVIAYFVWMRSPFPYSQYISIVIVIAGAILAYLILTGGIRVGP